LTVSRDEEAQVNKQAQQRGDAPEMTEVEPRPNVGRYASIALGAMLIGGGVGLLMGQSARPKARLAHRADGSDDSASFAAGIADEGTIPDVDPLTAR
jgi:hypothetical protein